MTDTTQEATELTDEDIMSMSEADFNAYMDATDDDEPEEEAEQEQVAPSEESATIEEDNAGVEDEDTPERQLALPTEEVVPEGDLDELFAPYTYRGKEVQLDSVADARVLINKGMDYTRKTQEIAKSKKIQVMLDDAGLLNEDDINSLINLRKGGKEALSAYMKKEGYDPMDLAPESSYDDDTDAVAYEPIDYRVSEDNLKERDVMQQLNASPSYDVTLKAISNTWDSESRQALASNPEDVLAIDNHVRNGVFDVITSVMNKEKLMGRLDGYTDLQAYRTVGKALESQGAFERLNGQRAAQQQPGNPEMARNKQRKAVGGSHRSAAPQQSDNNVNPLAMSDDDANALFAKLGL